MIRFEPYIGDLWGSPENELAGLRLLILGNSHHDKHGGNLVRTFSKDIVLEAEGPNGDQRTPFFTHLTQLVAGKQRNELLPEQRRHLWRSLAFYNYVQELLPESRRAPTMMMCRAAYAPYEKVLADLKPDAVLVLGRQTWAHLLESSGYTGRTGDIEHLDVKGVPHGFVYHPSGGFNWRTWRSNFEQLVSRGGKNRVQFASAG